MFQSKQQILRIKLVVVAVYSLLGFIQAIFSPEAVFAVTDALKKNGNDPIFFWVVLFVPVCFLVGSTIIYILGMKFLSIIPSLCCRDEKWSNVITPYFDYSWLSLVALSNVLVAMLCGLIRDAVTGNSDLWLHAVVFIVLAGYSLFLNYYICPKFCTEQQKQYFLGPFINSKIDSLIHRILGRKLKVEM